MRTRTGNPGANGLDCELAHRHIPECFVQPADVRRGVGGDPIRAETLATMDRLLAFAQALTRGQRRILEHLLAHEDDGTGSVTRQGIRAYLDDEASTPVSSRNVSLLHAHMAISPIKDGPPDPGGYEVFEITNVGKAMLRGEIPPDREWR